MAKGSCYIRVMNMLLPGSGMGWMVGDTRNYVITFLI